MLGKLFKHEFKNSYLEMVIINGAIIVITILNILLLQLKKESLLIVPIFTLSLLYGIAFVMIIINIIKSINNKLFTKEGYLTLTLPVSIDHLIISKLVVNLIWWVISFFVIAFSMVSLLLVTIGMEYDFTELITITEVDFISIISIAINSLIQVLLYLLILLLTLTLLNIGKIRKYRFIVGVGIYYGISMVINTVRNIVILIPYGIFFQDGELLIKKYGRDHIYPGSIFQEGSLLSFNNFFISIVFVGGLYFLSRYLITNKLELE